MTDMEKLQEWVDNSHRIVFFGGAGVSTESGIPDFRNTDGLYHQKYKYPPEEMLSHTMYERHTADFYDFYRDKLLYPDAKPNDAHKKLAELERAGKLSAIVTQNIDGLHQAAGSKTVYELHGSVLRNYCRKCHREYGLDFILHSTGIPLCPACGGVHLGYTGTGTQKVVTELKKLFPSARILRMDVDTTGGKEGHYKILKQFSDREADILVGTQMIAKGHDFPAVTLVGILDADMSLHFSDYRSGERTFQLVTQVAGRSGRGEEKGKVVLQTYDPANYILRFAIAYDYKGFYRHEIALRQATGFPPFARIVRVMVTAEEDAAALEALKEVYFSLKELFEANRGRFLFFNKMRSPVKRIQNRYRYQVLMRLTDDELLPEIYERALRAKKRDVLVYVEENPSNLS